MEFETAVSLTLSYDDVDIEINLPSTTDLHQLPQILEAISSELENGTLDPNELIGIVLPFVFDNGEGLWCPTTDWSVADNVYRYWGIQKNRYNYRTEFIDDIYDSSEHRFIHAPQESIISNVM